MSVVEINPVSLGFKGGLLLSGFFESCLQQHFLSPAGIFDDALKNILWKPDNVSQGTTDTKIYIAYKLKPKSPQSNFRPAILIERGDWTRQKVGMYDRAGMGDITYGDKVDMWTGSHTFTCLAKTFSAVEILAHEVATFFEVYGQILANQICLQELLLTGVSAPKLIMEDNETYCVVVSVNYKHYNSWSLEQLRPKIRHIRPVFTADDGLKHAPQTTLVMADD